MKVVVEAQFVERVPYPKRNPKSLRNFQQRVNWEEGPCPENCHVNHDEKWWGVTEPVPKKLDQPKKLHPKDVLVGAENPTKKDLERHRSLFGESPELFEVAETFVIHLNRRGTD